VVSRRRKRAGIRYPQSKFHNFRCWDGADLLVVYAEQAEVKASKDALVFNCAQRQSITLLCCYRHKPFSLKVPIKIPSSSYQWCLSRMSINISTGSSDNHIILAAPSLTDSTSPSTLHPFALSGPFRASLIPVGILQESPLRWESVSLSCLILIFFEYRSEQPCCIEWALRCSSVSYYGLIRTLN
jgi:hypothetical protein